MVYNYPGADIAGFPGVFKDGKMKFRWLGLVLLAGLVTVRCTPATPLPTPSDRDSGAIVYYSDQDGNWEIYVMDVDGSNQQRLTYNAARDALPRWSPDGEKIVFQSDRDGNWEIYVMNADGSDQQRLTYNEAEDEFPT